MREIVRRSTKLKKFPTRPLHTPLSPDHGLTRILAVK